MKRKDLLKRILAAGYTVEEGSNHTKVYKDGIWVQTVPRHAESVEFTARAILKSLGIR